MRALCRRIGAAPADAGGVDTPTAPADHYAVDVVCSAFEIVGLVIRGTEIGRPPCGILGGREERPARSLPDPTSEQNCGDGHVAER